MKSDIQNQSLQPLVAIFFLLCTLTSTLFGDEVPIKLPDYSKEADEFRVEFNNAAQELGVEGDLNPVQSYHIGGLGRYAHDTSGNIILLLNFCNLTRKALPKLEEAERLDAVANLTSQLALAIYRNTSTVEFIDGVVVPDLTNRVSLKEVGELRQLVLGLNRVYLPILKELLKFPKVREKLNKPTNDLLDQLVR